MRALHRGAAATRVPRETRRFPGTGERSRELVSGVFTRAALHWKCSSDARPSHQVEIPDRRRALRLRRRPGKRSFGNARAHLRVLPACNFAPAVPQRCTPGIARTSHRCRALNARRHKTRRFPGTGERSREPVSGAFPACGIALQVQQRRAFLASDEDPGSASRAPLATPSGKTKLATRVRMCASCVRTASHQRCRSDARFASNGGCRSDAARFTRDRRPRNRNSSAAHDARAG